MSYIIIRQCEPNETPLISEVVRKAYISNVPRMFLRTIFTERTLQCIVLLSAFMFIFLGIELQYCILAIPIILILTYILLYGSVLLKVAELFHTKKHLICWVAEAYEPYFFQENPSSCQYKIIPIEQVQEYNNSSHYRKSVIGTCALSKNAYNGDCTWLFRLAVDEKYRKKGIGLTLVETAQTWSQYNGFRGIEAAITEYQDEARHVFASAGFDLKMIYHKKLFSSIYTIQMFQLRSKIKI